MKLFKGKIGQYPKNLTGNLANSTVVHKKLRKKRRPAETDQFIFTLSQSCLKNAIFAPSSANWPKTGPDNSKVAPIEPSNPN